MRSHTSRIPHRQRDNAVALGEPTDLAEAPFFPPKPRGSADAAFAAAPVRHAGEYYVPIEHHNPMEPYASTAFFEPGGKLQIFDKTQGVQNVQRYVSSALEMKPDDVRVMSPYMGGGFGSGLRPQFQVLLAAMAARKLQRSVRVVLTRQQMYSLGYRPAMIQRIALGANAGGTLDAIRHEAVTVTLQYESFHRQETGWSGLLYKCPNAKYTTSSRASILPRRATCARRAPRRASTHWNARWTSWQWRSSSIRRASPAVLYRSRPEHRPALQQQGPARVLSPGCGGVRLGQAQPRAALDARRQRADGLGHGHRRLGSVAGADCGAHRALCEWPCGGFLRDVPDIGTGTYTIMMQVAADMLGLPPDRVTVKLGDSTLPQSPVEGGSWIAASVSNGIATTCDAIRADLLQLAKRMPNSPLADAAADEVSLADGKLVSKRDHSRAVSIEDAMRTAAVDRIEQEKPTTFPNDGKYAHNTHSAIFAEVKVDEQLGVIRVTRVVNAVAAGRILNPKDGGEPDCGGRGVGHRHGPARGDARRPQLRPHHECRYRRVPCARARRRPRTSR